MSEPFLAEIRIVGFNFAPRGWAFCNGQLLAIAQNTALFSLLGTAYGGNGVTTFGLPNLQGSAPIHQGQGAGLSPRVLGETAGESAVTLIQTEIPSHTHTATADSGNGNQTSPTNNTWSSLAGRTPPPLYASTGGASMSPQAIGITGGSQPHNNLSPYLTLNFIITLQGIFPPRS